MNLNQYNRPVTRQERREQLLAMWNDRSKRGKAEVLSLCHRALPEGTTLQAGMSAIEVILDHEFGPSEVEDASVHRQSA